MKPIGVYKTITDLIYESKPDEARDEVHTALKTISAKGHPRLLYTQANLYGFLIDIGCDSKNENDLRQAIAFYEKNGEELQSIITKPSYFYNLANAYSGLSQIYFLSNRGVPKVEIIKTTLQQPISLYWQAFKSLSNKDTDTRPKILINLSNSLTDAGRIIEAIQFLDIVLANTPSYPQAITSLADHIWRLSLVTNCTVTGSLYGRIFELYDYCINKGILPNAQLERCINQREKAKNKIESLGFDVSTIQVKMAEAQQEFEKHKEYRKFCINNFLTLNEHAVYCNCSQAQKDDLQIGVKHAKFIGAKVPKLELLLNRMKSEFSLARWLFHQSTAKEQKLDSDTLYSELLDGEIINSETELLRTSFRTCYGILDKIAKGICKLYDLTGDTDNVLFEAFWNPANQARWSKINQIKNMHLSALYSIASDLNTKTGELKHFKDWRNKLEHGILILKDTKKETTDPLGIYKDVDFFSIVDIDDFREKTMHLLQLTRAAIFSFVYCVRLQTIETITDEEKGNGHLIDFKNS